jgi:PAS domain S-box-containing protein
VKNLPLKSKGLLLVTIPLVFQIGFVIVLLYFLNQADLESQREIRSKNIIIHAQSVLANMYQAAVSVMRFRTIGDPGEGDASDSYMTQTKSDLRQLEESLQYEPSERPGFEPNRDMILKQLKGLAWRKGEIEKGHPDPLSPAERIGHYREMGDIVEYFRELAERQKKKAAVQLELSQKTRRAVQNFVIIGVAGNLVVGIAFALFFSNEILKRIGILSENAQRLARSEALIPELDGKDEVAELDKVFHTMAGKLTEAMRKEKAVVDNAPDLICSLSADGKFLRVNPAVEAVLGKTSESLIGTASSELISDGLLQASSKDGSEFRFETNLMNGAAQTEYFSWTGQWAAEEQSYFCIGRNITAQRQLEQFKQELMEMVSHDLRTPLTSIRTGMELVLEGSYGDLNDKITNKLQKMNNNVSSLVKLVNDLLDLQKSEAGCLSIFKEDSLVSEITGDSVHAVQTLADSKKITIVTKANVESLNADGERLKQVLSNFLGNAVKFSPEGSEIKIEVNTIDNEVPQIEFRVCDHGRGVPANMVDTIFERFRQINPGDAAERKGTGLGLAIAKAIVLAHDGTIGVSPNQNGGSIFWFRIPS